MCSLVKALLTAPEPFQKDGEARLLVAEDFTFINGKGRDQCIEAVTLMRDAQQWMKAIADLSGTSAAKHLSEMQVHMFALFTEA